MKDFIGGYSVQINLGQVRKIERLNGGLRVYWQNGDDETFMKDDKFQNQVVEAFEEGIADKYHVVKADPGYELVRVWEGKAWRSPVIAWRVDREVTEKHLWDCIAIGIDGNSMEKDCAIVCPNGTVIATNQGSWENVDNWLKELKATEAAE